MAKAQIIKLLPLGNSISSINYQLTTNCPPNANGSSLNSSAEGLPEGVNYSFSGQNNTIIISGTPTTLGTYTYNLTYYNNQTIQGSTVSASVAGQITVLADYYNKYLNNSLRNFSCFTKRQRPSFTKCQFWTSNPSDWIRHNF